MEPLALIFLTLAGLCVGSFTNVLIFRIPRGEEFVRTPSHCMSCGHRLSWYENIPLVSFLLQGGKCRHCGVRLSRQYPAVEALTGIMWLLTGLLFWGDWVRLALYCALFPLLAAVAVIDWRTFTIPDGLNLAIGALGAVQLVLDRGRWPLYTVGMVLVSGFFLLLWALTRGRGLGLGDVKLMAAAGLLLGWQRILLAMLLGCVLGAVIHSLRMRRGAGHKLAFGPYLAAGIWIAALFGDGIVSAYAGLLGL
ncbi:MAG: prepilin peptidase [Oscillibacter sp.]|nr:prepilin peptidase [Oscillibacter sp.]